VLESKFKNHVVGLPVPHRAMFFEFSILIFFPSYRQKATHFWQILPEKFIFQVNIFS